MDGADAGGQAAKRESAPRDRYGDFEVTREWWTGDAVPEATVVAIREKLEGIKLSPRPRL